RRWWWRSLARIRRLHRMDGSSGWRWGRLWLLGMSFCKARKLAFSTTKTPPQPLPKLGRGFKIKAKMGTNCVRPHFCFYDSGCLAGGVASEVFRGHVEALEDLG